MTAVAGTHRGKSFLDLSGELRNAIYEHFIDPDPSIEKAVKLLSVNRQIRSEFGSLYLSQVYVAVASDRVDSFIRGFFLGPANIISKNVACGICVYLGRGEGYWSLDLLQVVSLMRQYPLLDTVWNIFHIDLHESFKMADVASVVTMMRGMDAQNFETLARVNLLVTDCRLVDRLSIPEWFLGRSLDAELDIFLKSNGTKPDVRKLGFGVRFGGIRVNIDWEDSLMSYKDGSDSNTEEPDGSEDSERGS